MAWAVLGAAGTVGLVSLGWIVLAPALIAGALMRRHATACRSTAGVPAGAGLVFLFVAYQQRQGPGVTCWHRGTARGCDQYLSPIPWLVIGLLLLIGSVLVQKRPAT